MAKSTDVLKELEAMGALKPFKGNPTPIVPTAMFPSSFGSTEQDRALELLSRFVSKVDSLEVSLRGLLSWCEDVRAVLLDPDPGTNTELPPEPEKLSISEERPAEPIVVPETPARQVVQNVLSSEELAAKVRSIVLADDALLRSGGNGELKASEGRNDE